MMKAVPRRRPLFEQGCGKGFELRPCCKRLRRRTGIHQKTFDAEDMQVPRGRSMGRPQLHQGGDIQPGAEAELEDGEERSPLPRLGEMAAA